MGAGYDCTKMSSVSLVKHRVTKKKPNSPTDLRNPSDELTGLPLGTAFWQCTVGRGLGGVFQLKQSLPSFQGKQAGSSPGLGQPAGSLVSVETEIPDISHMKFPSYSRVLPRSAGL